MTGPEGRPGDVGRPTARGRGRVVPPRLAHAGALSAAPPATDRQRVAVVAPGLDGPPRLTYRELDALSARIAAGLQHEGVGPGTRVGLVARRDGWLIPSLLAVLRSGAAYVPLDPRAPGARWRTVLEVAGVQHVLASHGVPATEGFAGEAVTNPSELAEGTAEAPSHPVIDPADEAYVLFTSGSTGTPKGVSVTHGNVVARIESLRRFHEPPHVALLTTSLCFDASLATVLPVLATGGTLVVGPDDAAADPSVAAELVASHGVTFIANVPSWYLGLLDLAPPGALRTLRRVVTGGEAMPPGLVRRHHELLPACALVNEYGPTEATIAATAFEVPSDWSGTAVPIGLPHPNTTVHVVDDGNLAPPGRIGELWIAGPGVAHGYVGRPDGDVFVDDPFGDGRAYRTGDLAHWTEDGLLELHGRKDRQVKILGERVEPDETEAVLLGLADVAQAAVEVDRTGPAPRLVGYVAGHDGRHLDGDEVRRRLGELLPPAQVPPTVVVCDRLPLTVGGKVDRAALPAPPPVGTFGHAPLDDVEAAVADAVAEVLGVRVGPADDFYGVGGDSLAAARVLARLRRQLQVDLHPGDLRDHPTVADLASLARRRPARADRTVARVARDPDGGWTGRATPAQTSFWYLEQEDGRAGGSNLVEVVHLHGVDRSSVERALDLLADRHESLRTALRLGPDGLEQVVAPRGEVRVPCEPLDPDADADARARELGRCPFDLGVAPLVRAHVADAADGVDVVLVVHHAIADGWAVDVLVDELVALALDPGTTLAQKEVDAVDVAVWLHDRTEGDGAAAASRFLERLRRGAELRGGVLPYDRRLTGDSHHVAAARRRRLDAGVVASLGAVSRRCGASPFSTLTAMLAVTLRRFGAPEDLLVGTATANRPLPELERVVACTTNFVPIRVDARGERSVADVIRGVAEDVVASDEWGWLPVEAVLGDHRDGEPLALPDVMVSMLNQRVSTSTAPRHGVSLPHVLTDLDVVCTTAEDGALDVEVHHDPRRLLPTTVDRLLDAWLELVARLPDHLDAPVDDLVAPGPGDRRDAEVLGGDEGPVPAGTVLDLVWPHVDGRPDRAALIDTGAATSWGELGDRARRLAASLARDGVGRGDHVLVTADRAPAVEALLACWWLGAVPVPLGDRQPATKVAALARRVDASAVLDEASMAERLARPDDVPHVEAVPLVGDDPAYVLFTSGSTGEPKGVVVPHRALLASTLARLDHYADAPQVALLGHDMAFDAALGIAVWYLAMGGTLVTPGHDERLDPVSLARLIDEHGVGQIDLVPSHLRLLLDQAPADGLGSLRLVTTGAEACPPSLVDLHLRRLPGVRLVNEYGPTECTVWTVAHDCTADDVEQGLVPIGRPVLGTVARVADAEGRPMPRGAIGELLLAGHLLADGYIGDPAQTAARFVEIDGRRWYRTGDRVRWNDDGELEFHGRSDDQLKVRGYRIEPGEVDAVLRDHPDVLRAATWTHEVVAGAPVLVAWVQPRPGVADDLRDDVLAHCRTRLPEWMVPSVVVTVDAMPLTTSGKVDRRRLPPPEPSDLGHERVPPSSPLERAIVGVWEALLGRPVGMFDNFFDLGGHSLLAARLVSELTGHLGVTVQLPDLLEDATPAHLVQVVTARLDAEPVESRGEASITVLREGSLAPLVIVARDGETSLYLRHVLRAIDEDRPLWLLIRPMPRLHVRRADLAHQGRLVADAIAGACDGTVHLLGHSASGLVALEAARHLGSKMGRLVLLDTLRAMTGWERRKHPLHRVRRWATSPATERAARAEARAARAAVRSDPPDPHAARLVRDEQDERGFLRLRGRRYDGALTVLAATDTQAVVGDDLGWSRWCDDVIVRTLPSDHFGVLLPPHVDETVTAIGQLLDGQP
ncbi:non-ribosomal peptide synthetase [Actinomarinicola tropica]|uniref:Amino acid adenylation domain-containing protein n=1 Tax=Actinomarinicola tropica TaxID=2789776 RepID=A0A5Q2RNJ6_9ACTN|nr:non-ribosomal peptide synthetase [Actinomarinicola tropica]QGG94765.1 amino acid adenylation domain-containing protein [Actinomarinicola tropica]